MVRNRGRDGVQGRGRGRGHGRRWGQREGDNVGYRDMARVQGRG